MAEPAKTSKKEPEHPQVVSLKASIAKREERLKSAKGDERTAQEIVLNKEKQRLEALTK